MATVNKEEREAQEEFNLAWKAVEDFAGDALANRLAKAAWRLSRVKKTTKPQQFEPLLP